MCSSFPSQQEARFFHLLPVDVQHHILQHWIARHDDERGLLRLLSAMDIACCSHGCRDQALMLMGRVLLPAYSECARKVVFTPLAHLWLSSRQIQINYVLYRGGTVDLNDGFVLSSVETLVIYLHNSADFRTRDIANLLSLCPNVTALWVMDVLVTTDWELLFALMPKLRKLTIDRLPEGSHENASAFLKTLPESLEELRIPYHRNQLDDDVLAVWTARLRKLKVLHAGFASASAGAVTQLVAACKELEYLNVGKSLDLTIGTVLEDILSAGRTHLKTLCSNTFRPQNPDNFVPVLTICERFPWLENFRVQICEVSRAEKLFSVVFTESLTVAILKRILVRCVGTTKLEIGTWEGHAERNVFMTMIGEKLHESLLEVNIAEPINGSHNSITRDDMSALLLRAPNVTSLRMDSMAIDANLLPELVAMCPGLRHFDSNCHVNAIAMRTGILIDVLKACGQHLKSVSMHNMVVSWDCLQVILERRLRLEVLRCRNVPGGFAVEVANFSVVAFVMQLLPVLRLELRV